MYGRRRKVRCSFCGTSGHNRAGCPSVVERAKNGSSYAASLLERKKESSSSRTCTYCRNKGHNRTTCQKLITDYVEAVKNNAEYRKNLLSMMKKAGIGIGSLLCSRYSETPISIVTDILWDRIVYSQTHLDCLCLDGEEYSSVSLELKSFKENNGQVTYENYYANLESPVSPEQIESQVPADWLSGKSEQLRSQYGVNEKKLPR